MRQAGNRELAGKYERYADEKTEALRRDPRWYEGLGLFAATDAANAGSPRPPSAKPCWPGISPTACSGSHTRPSTSISYCRHWRPWELTTVRCTPSTIAGADNCAMAPTTFFEVFRPSWNDCKLSDNDAPVNNQCGYTSLTTRGAPVSPSG